MVRDQGTCVMMALYLWKGCKESMRDNNSQLEKVQACTKKKIHDGIIKDYCLR